MGINPYYWHISGEKKLKEYKVIRTTYKIGLYIP